MITIHVPRNTAAPNLKNELSSAKRIKDRTVRNNTFTGLNKIAQYL